jgi:hypothetical protein
MKRERGNEGESRKDQRGPFRGQRNAGTNKSNMAFGLKQPVENGFRPLSTFSTKPNLVLRSHWSSKSVQEFGGVVERN